jgi:hypothetical protein
MHPTVLALFAIPVICIIVIVVSQFWDEMFKKEFVIDRRKRSPGAPGSAKDRSTKGEPSMNRRYSDAKLSEQVAEAASEPYEAKGSATVKPVAAMSVEAAPAKLEPQTS